MTMQESVIEGKFLVGRWPQERLVKTRVVSGFIFLRLLCPAILNPRQVLEEKFFYSIEHFGSFQFGLLCFSLQ